MNKLIALLILAALPSFASAAPGGAAKPFDITVYRSPSCSCCGKWMEHLRKNGFAIKEIQSEDMAPIKRQHGVTDELKSCHTALIGGYVVEGHVPAGDIKTLLEKKPAVTGLSVPGMPVGTPGMEMGDRHDPYAVVQFDRSGAVRVFHDYPGQ